MTETSSRVFQNFLLGILTLAISAATAVIFRLSSEVSVLNERVAGHMKFEEEYHVEERDARKNMESRLSNLEMVNNRHNVH